MKKRNYILGIVMIILTLFIFFVSIVYSGIMMARILNNGYFYVTKNEWILTICLFSIISIFSMIISVYLLIKLYKYVLSKKSVDELKNTKQYNLQQELNKLNERKKEIEMQLKK